MRRTLYRRQLALAAAAAVGVVAVLAATRLRHPAAVLPPAQGAYRALAGAMPAAAVNPHLSDCAYRIVPSIEGVANPVLPCGTRLYLGYRGRTVLASVVGHDPVPSGREFSLTPALARSLRLTGVHEVVWSYAGGPAP